MKFTDLPLNETILQALDNKGYAEPTPIQEQAIPLILERRDLLGCAQTGTGKTAAFSIPTLQILSENKDWGNGIKVLIVTPTRELAIQIDENIAEYSQGLGFKHTVIFGGVKANAQIKKLQNGIDILTATPGRLIDLMNQGFVSLRNLKIFTLDEADRMLDMGFIHDVKKIIDVLPPKRQSLFFSATMPKTIIQLANSLLTNPSKVTVAPVSSTAETVDQKLYLVKTADKKSLLTHILQDRSVRSVLVFTQTKHRANKVADFVNSLGISAAAIHGNKSQKFRQTSLKNFKNGELKVLVATDLASRGIDINELSHVINFEIPNEPETYVHRIGRTGRAKNTGVAISFCDEEEGAYVHDIQKLICKEIPREEDHPFHFHHEISASCKKPKRKQNGRFSRGNSSPRNRQNNSGGKKFKRF